MILFCEERNPENNDTFDALYSHTFLSRKNEPNGYKMSFQYWVKAKV